MNDDNLREKKLRGSGGYVYAKVTEEEQKRGNLGGPELFIAGVGRLEQDRFSKYFCNKCEREYEGSPAINYENPNEELGEGVTLAEKGEYKCRTCDNILAQYRKFGAPSLPDSKISAPKDESPAAVHKDEASSVANSHQPGNTPSTSSINAATVSPTPSITKATTLRGKVGFVPIQSLIGMPAYNSEAILVGRVKEIGLRSSEGIVQISIKIERESGNNVGNNNSIEDEVLWNNISKIGDIVLLSERVTKIGTSDNASFSTKGSVNCPSCGYQNQENASFCEECGKKLI
ncbi:MAG TPA: zinc-ribbon domain-containing protein [Nitrososphaeraceae archaeon]